MDAVRQVCWQTLATSRWDGGREEDGDRKGGTVRRPTLAGDGDRRNFHQGVTK